MFQMWITYGCRCRLLGRSITYAHFYAKLLCLPRKNSCRSVCQNNCMYCTFICTLSSGLLSSLCSRYEADKKKALPYCEGLCKGSKFAYVVDNTTNDVASVLLLRIRPVLCECCWHTGSLQRFHLSDAIRTLLSPDCHSLKRDFLLQL
jgi:hypothetical protein